MPGQPGPSEDIDYDVPGPLIDLTAEGASIVFTLPVGVDPVTPGIRSVILLNRPGGPSGPVGEPSDFITLTAFDPVPELRGLTQTFEIVFQSENAPGFDVDVFAVQSTGAPEIFLPAHFRTSRTPAEHVPGADNPCRFGKVRTNCRTRARIVFAAGFAGVAVHGLAASLNCAFFGGRTRFIVGSLPSLSPVC